MAKYGARTIKTYTRAVAATKGVPPPQPPETPEGEVVAGTEPQAAYLSEEERLAAGETAEPGGPWAATPPGPLPYLVIAIVGLAYLTPVASKELQDSITKLAQM